MLARTCVSVLITIVLMESWVWAFSGVHRGMNPLPEPQIGKVRQENYNNLDHLKVGMSREQVSNVMKDRKEIQTYNLGEKAETLSNPVRIESESGKDGTVIEIRYYYAYQKKGDLKVTTDELCPVAFIDGILAWWGWEYYVKEIGSVPAGP